MRWPRLALILLLLMTWGCATKAAVRLPVTFCPPKPPLVLDGRLTTDGMDWLVACINAGRLNCVAMQANNGEDPKRCDLTPIK